MHSEFSAETHDRISTLCRRISVANHLNEEIEQELRDHMIDKMESYLNGEEALSEDDAFVLVKEHFGNPHVIQSMYESAEPGAVYGSMLRRVEAATVATILCFILGSYVFELLFSLLANLTPDSLVQETFIFAIPKILSQLIGVALFGMVLSHWRGKIKRGEQLWFYTIKHYWSLGLILASALVMVGIITATSTRHLPYNVFTLYTLLGSIMFHCILWVTWIDNNSERIRSILLGFISWIVIGYFIMEVIFRVFIFNYPISLTNGFIHPIYIWWLGLPGMVAFFIYTMLVAIHKVKIKLIGSLA